jgi:hypothetical protein
MIDRFLRNAGKHVATRSISKIGRGYFKVNAKVKSGTKSLFAARLNAKLAKKQEQSDRIAEKKMQERLAKTTKRAKQDTKRTGLYVVRGRGGRG